MVNGSPPAGALEGEPTPLSVVGHEWAVDLLQRQLEQERVAHAYLFTGPPMVGKGTLARWFAQALLCTADGQRPCGACLSCRKVSAGVHPDLRLLNLETQEGKRRTVGIESIRDLRTGIAERPFQGQRKVYLVEDVETMTREASNALLKTLEEPPSFVVLLLVALSDHLLLPTIVSRCQQVSLRVLSRQEVREALVHRWGAEGEQADSLAALSLGRIGWAVRMLQDDELLREREQDLDLLQRLMESGLLERFSFAEGQERRWKRKQHQAVLRLLERWQAWWRDLLLVESRSEDLVTNVDRLDVLRAVDRQVDRQTAVRFLQALRAAEQYLQEQVNPRLVFEHLLLQMPTVVV